VRVFIQGLEGGGGEEEVENFTTETTPDGIVLPLHSNKKGRRMVQKNLLG